MSHKIASVTIVAALICGLTACGSSDPSAPSAPATDTATSSATASASSVTTPSESSAPSATAKGAEAVIMIKDFAYEVPRKVAPGAAITIRNSDSQAHTLSSKEGGFDVKVDGSGTATLNAPSKPGRYAFVCSFHGGMTGTLVVG